MTSLLKYFLQGLLVVAPIGVTIYVLYEAFVILDGLIPLDIPGLGLLVILVGIFLVGFIGNNLISDRLRLWLNRIIRRAPVFSLIYSAVRDVLNALVGEKRSFKYPVLVQLGDNPAVKRIGFVTHRGFGKDAELPQEYLTVYCPHSYAVSGQLYLVEKERVEALDLPAADVMKYIISAGVTRIEEAPKSES